MGGGPWFQAALLVSAILTLSLSHGSAREIMEENFGYKDNAAVSLEERAREMMQLDYVEAGPNVNARSGYLFSPPSPPPPPPPPPPPHHRLF